MENKELFLAMAKFMGVALVIVGDEFICNPSSNVFEVYNPLTNGTQLNEFIEKARFDITWKHEPIEWFCDSACTGDNASDKDRDTSALKCAAAMLGVEYEI